jgi:CheY-like chemotaxis protein
MARILLVDDDEALRKVLARTLILWGHEVLEASNGLDALAAQELEPVDLMVTDLIMPRKEGIETIKECRRKHPTTKIIAMSGGGRSGAADYLRMAKALGADGALSKPFSNQMMADAINQLLEPPPPGKP